MSEKMPESNVARSPTPGPGSATRRATMRDVARLAGVGMKTVSRVINSEPNVSAATLERVNRAIAQLSYEPDIHAGSLRRAGGATRTVGLLVGSVANPFSGSIHRAVEDEAVERG